MALIEVLLIGTLRNNSLYCDYTGSRNIITCTPPRPHGERTPEDKKDLCSQGFDAVD